MTDDPEKKPRKPARTPAEIRAERLKAELRANLARRKQQSRARREGGEDDRAGQLLPGKPVDGD